MKLTRLPPLPRRTMQSYDYTHRNGVESITWDRFVSLCASLAERLASHRIDTVVGVARAGLLPATTVACALRCDLFPVRLTRRSRDEVVHRHPVWLVDVSPEVRGRRAAVIDEIADTGRPYTSWPGGCGNWERRRSSRPCSSATRGRTRHRTHVPWSETRWSCSPGTSGYSSKGNGNCTPSWSARSNNSLRQPDDV